MIKVKGALRCAYCHGDALGLLECCEECGVLLHADCRRNLGRCSSLGCTAPSTQSPVVQFPRTIQAPRRIWGPAAVKFFKSVLFLTLFVGLLLGGCLVSTGPFVTIAEPSSIERADAIIDRADAMSIRDAALLYRLERGRFPDSVSDLVKPYEGSPEGFLEIGYLDQLHGYHLVSEGRRLWVGVEILDEGQRGTNKTIRLLRLVATRPIENSAEAESGKTSEARGGQGRRQER